MSTPTCYIEPLRNWPALFSNKMVYLLRKWFLRSWIRNFNSRNQILCCIDTWHITVTKCPQNVLILVGLPVIYKQAKKYQGWLHKAISLCSFRVVVLRILVTRCSKPFAWEKVFHVKGLYPFWLIDSFKHPELSISSLFYFNWIAYTYKQCSLFTGYFCLSIILLIQARLWLMELVSDAGIYSDRWTQLTQGSTISCQVIEQNPICIKQIPGSRL